MITVLGISAFLGLWALLLWLEVVRPRLKRRKAARRRREACVIVRNEVLKNMGSGKPSERES